METRKRKCRYIVSLILGVSLAHLINFTAVESLRIINPSIPYDFLWRSFYIMGLAFFMSLHLSLFFLYLLEPPNTDAPLPPSDEDLPFISVIIPAYNEEKSIASTIEAVLKSGYPEDKMEVIVVDDGSTDKTAEIARRYPVRLIRNERNMGRGAAIHRGIKSARGEIVVMVDADTYLKRNALKYISSEFQNSRIGAVCGFLIPDKPTGFLGRQQKVEYLLGYAYNKHIRANTGWMLIPSGAFSAYRRELVKDLEATDTIAEDFDMGLYIHERGYNLRYVPWAQAHTDIPLTLPAYLRQRLRWSLGGLQALAKHRHMMMRGKKPSVGLWGLPYHYIMGYAVPPMELLGTAMLLVLPLFTWISWVDVAWLFLWLFSIKFYSLLTLLPARRYAQKITGIKIPLWQLFEYWFAYYYLLLFTTLSGLVTYMKKGCTGW